MSQEVTGSLVSGRKVYTFERSDLLSLLGKVPPALRYPLVKNPQSIEAGDNRHVATLNLAALCLKLTAMDLASLFGQIGRNARRELLFAWGVDQQQKVKAEAVKRNRRGPEKALTLTLADLGTGQGGRPYTTLPAYLAEHPFLSGAVPPPSSTVSPGGERLLFVCAVCLAGPAHGEWESSVFEQALAWAEDVAEGRATPQLATGAGAEGLTILAAGCVPRLAAILGGQPVLAYVPAQRAGQVMARLEAAAGRPA